MRPWHPLRSRSGSPPTHAQTMKCNSTFTTATAVSREMDMLRVEKAEAERESGSGGSEYRRWASQRFPLTPAGGPGRSPVVIVGAGRPSSRI